MTHTMHIGRYVSLYTPTVAKNGDGFNVSKFIKLYTLYMYSVLYANCSLIKLFKKKKNDHTKYW